MTRSGLIDLRRMAGLPIELPEVGQPGCRAERVKPLAVRIVQEARPSEPAMRVRIMPASRIRSRAESHVLIAGACIAHRPRSPRLTPGLSFAPSGLWVNGRRVSLVPWLGGAPGGCVGVDR